MPPTAPKITDEKENMSAPQRFGIMLPTVEPMASPIQIIGFEFTDTV